MQGETAEQAAARAAQRVIDRIRSTDEDGRPRRVCDHHESMWGRCAACGMTWTQQAAQIEDADQREQDGIF